MTKFKLVKTSVKRVYYIRSLPKLYPPPKTGHKIQEQELRLIITEKVNAAKRIAAILSKGKFKAGKQGTIQVFTFDNGVETVCIGLRGHILRVDFPEEYSHWQNVDPSDLVHADIIKTPLYKNIVKLVESNAKKASEIIVATDFDREGELIGVDALNIAKAVNPKLEFKRARFSALTEGEIRNAFDNLDEVYFSLASAGEARQDIDLVWGATLTRFISLASTRLGKQFLSVGRVQSPTLALIAKRERERLDFVPEKYWQIKVLVEKDGEEIQFSHKTERFTSQAEAEKAFASIAETGEVVEIKRTERQIDPPAPFNTTGLLTAAASIGITAPRAMSTAEALYLDGLTSYPRVDNTVYPPSLDLRGLLKVFDGNKLFGPLAKELLALKELKPTRGKKESTDHPPIHPTASAEVSTMEGQYGKIYELIVRRYMATLAPAARSEGMRIDVTSGGEGLFTRGTRLLDEGFIKYYPYGRKKDDELPGFEKSEVLKIKDKVLEEKETLPPARYSQSQLILQMEDLGLGTKSTRHNIIQNLYERRYIHGDPINPTELGLKVAEALIKYAERITSPDMTAELENAMNEIAEGSVDRATVVKRSREMLAQIMVHLKEQKEALGSEIREGIRNDMTVGVCPNCGKELIVRRAKKTKKRFVGCSGYPDCNTIYPLPQFGEVISTGEKCSVCGAPRVKIISKGKRPWEICINIGCETNKREDKKAGGANASGEGDEDGAEDKPKFPPKVGKCPKCSKDMKVMFSRKRHKYFIGCSNFPKCKNAFPLPPGEFEDAEKACDACSSPLVNLVQDGERSEYCIDANCETHKDAGESAAVKD